MATTGVDHSLRQGVLGFLAILMVVPGLVLLITCLNVGSMLLARATSRQQEMAIRLAVGAGRGHLVKQLLTETVVLFALGGIGGAIVAERLTHALLALVATVPVPIGFQLAIDWRVLLFTAAAALLTALLAGLFPAREALRQDPIAALRAGGDQGERRASRLRNAFVVAQTAGAVVLMIVAGLFVRSLREGMTIDLGFEADRVAATRLVLPETKYDTERGRLFYRDLEDRVGRLPGVESAALARQRPIGVTRNPIEIQVPGYDPPPSEPAVLVETNAVGTTYFATMDIPVVSGRNFLRSDVQTGSQVAIVNTTAAERFWPGNDPTGKQFIRDGETVTVVGVAASSRYLVQDDTPIGYVYFPIEQAYSPRMTLLVRSSGDPVELRAQIQDIIATIDADLPAIDLMTLREGINFSLLPQRVAAAVTAALGIFGLALAALGIYGILSHAVARRTREIGIRLALGGRPASVVGLVVASGMRLVAAGILLGTALALGVTPLLRSFLVGVAPADPITLTTVILVFVSVASLACLLPARRAIKIDPAMTLRFE